MKILLLAMPDSTNNFYRMISIPNLGLASIAGNLPGHDVRIVDLVLIHKNITPHLEKILADFSPDLVGVSSMSFQYKSAETVMGITRRVLPKAKIALGGYHPTLLHEEITTGKETPELFDFVIRGEGEETFRLLADALERQKTDLSEIPGLTWFSNGAFRHNERGGNLDLSTLPLPDRSKRVLKDFKYLNKKVDSIETSRGCLFICNFCSITNMYGQTFRPFPIERIMADLRQLKADGVESVFIVDDNITQDTDRMKEICRKIISDGLNSMEYFVQATVSGIAGDPELVTLMKSANFQVVFLGIESVLKKNLKYFRKGDIVEKTKKAVAMLRQHEIAIMGGFIIGNPTDTAEDVKEVFRQAKAMNVDLAMIQCVTPYPKTPLREDLLKQGLVTNPDDLTRYTGYQVNVRTEHLTEKELNRLLNWENIKMFFSPFWFKDNNLVKRRERGSAKVMMNNFEYIRGYFTGDQFRSRHTF